MAFLTNCWIDDILLVIGVLLAAIYASFKRSYQFWKKKGFPEVKPPRFPYGSFSREKPLDDALKELYKSAKNEKVSGIYMFKKPVLLVRDLDLVKNILVKEFGSFHDRGSEGGSKLDPLSQHLFAMNGQEWRNLRIKLTPTFTSGKMKMMFPTLFAVGEQLVEVLEKESEEPEVEVRDIFSRYTTDVIASIAFGLESNSLKNPDCDFRLMGQEILKPGLRRGLVLILSSLWPNFQNFLPIRLLPGKVSDFFVNTIRDVMDYRVKNDVQRKDFLQLLLQLKTLGYIPDADTQSKEDIDNVKEFTVEQAAAQAFLFFFAGFETLSSTMVIALYEMALNPEIQKEVQEEIEKVMEKHGGVITYDAMLEMELLDRVVSETLRKYPVATLLMRQCNKDFKIPDSDLTIEKGMNLIFSLHGFHHDPEIYPEPEKFSPDRFLPEEKKGRHPSAYMPFGDGPRNCIGSRLALIQTKAVLATTLAKFSVGPSKNTEIPLKLGPQKKTVFLKFTKRQNS